MRDLQLKRQIEFSRALVQLTRQQDIAEDSVWRMRVTPVVAGTFLEDLPQRCKLEQNQEDLESQYSKTAVWQGTSSVQVFDKHQRVQ